jgi:multicomponent K+:H+ antiporter subunit G
MNALPVWAQVVVALLLVASGLLVLVSAVGFLRLREFFLRMHPPALAYTLASWCVAGACILYFSMQAGHLVLFPLAIPLLLAITVPVTTVLLARVALFRGRLAGAADIPSTLPPPEFGAAVMERDDPRDTPPG